MLSIFAVVIMSLPIGIENVEASSNHVIRQNQLVIPLMQPLGSSNNISYTATNAMEPFFKYFTNSYDWMLAVAVGIATVWVLICGAAIMITGDSGKQWKERIIFAIVGVIILTFFDVILKLLNAWFFQ